MTEQERTEVLSQGPRIIHFSGPISRPWVKSFDPKHMFHDEWFAALDATPWAGWRPTELANCVLARLFTQHHDTKDLKNKRASDIEDGAEACELESLIGNPR